MVHIAAIRTALDRNDTEAIESAFRALTEFPQAGFIDGADSIDVLTETLDRVIDHLSNDRAIMPFRTFETIVRAQPNTLAEVASYAEGARVVAAHRKHWHAVFLMHVAPEPREGSRIGHGRSVEAPASVTFELPRTRRKGSGRVHLSPDRGWPFATRGDQDHSSPHIGEARLSRT